MMKRLISHVTLMVVALVVVLVVAGGFAACNRSSAPAATTPSAAAAAPAPMAAPVETAAPAANDKVSQKLQELAGTSATNCGRLGLTGNLQAASDCALKANKAKQSFYVAYDMPGLTVGVAGAANGKLYAIQSGVGGGGGAAATVTATECPAALRVAQSGRVTCVSPGSMGVAGGASSPHAGMTMPPAGTGSPHGAMPMPPAGTPNPHQGGVPIEGAKSH